MTANPTLTSNPVLLALCDRLAGGCQVLETEIGILRNTEAVMRAAYKKLRSRVRGLTRELWIVLPETDARWKRSGLNIPARLSMPESVSTVTLTAQANGDVLIEWPPAAHYCRWPL